MWRGKLAAKHWSKTKALISDVLLSAVLVPHIKWDNRSGRGNTQKGIKPWNMELEVKLRDEEAESSGWAIK